MAKERPEVWKNNANGPRWYIYLDPTGREETKIVPPRRTFTIMPFERQINQARAYSPEADLFRDGTFTIVTPSAETNPEEFESVNARTEEEIAVMAKEIVAEPAKAKKILASLSAPTPVMRLYEELVLEDAPNSVIQAAKKRMNDFEAVVPLEREIVATAPDVDRAAGPKVKPRRR